MTGLRKPEAIGFDPSEQVLGPGRFRRVIDGFEHEVAGPERRCRAAAEGDGFPGGTECRQRGRRNRHHGPSITLGGRPGRDPVLPPRAQATARSKVTAWPSTSPACLRSVVESYVTDDART